MGPYLGFISAEVVRIVNLIGIGHVRASRVPLARLAVRGMPPAPLAVLAKLQPLRVVALALIGLVVAALAVLACEGCSNPYVATGHGSSPRKVWKGCVTCLLGVLAHAGRRCADYSGCRA